MRLGHQSLCQAPFGDLRIQTSARITTTRGERNIGLSGVLSSAYARIQNAQEPSLPRRRTRSGVRERARPVRRKSAADRKVTTERSPTGPRSERGDLVPRSLNEVRHNPHFHRPYPNRGRPRHTGLHGIAVQMNDQDQDRWEVLGCVAEAG